jgi:hypothetical protein
MIFAPLRAKPWLGAVFGAFVLAGIGIGWLAFPPQWGAGLRVVFGALLGVGAMLSLYLPRMIATDYDD